MTELQETSTSAGARKPTPAELERIIRYEQSARWLTREVRERITGELLKIRRRLDQLSCSSAWTHHCWQSGEHFPPRADTTPMRACQCERCKRTGRLWPAHYSASQKQSTGDVGGFISYECYLEGLTDWSASHLPSSPSGLALRAIREGRIKLRRERTHTRGRRFHS